MHNGSAKLTRRRHVFPLSEEPWESSDVFDVGAELSSSSDSFDTKGSETESVSFSLNVLDFSEMKSTCTCTIDG